MKVRLFARMRLRVAMFRRLQQSRTRLARLVTLALASLTGCSSRVRAERLLRMLARLFVSRRPSVTSCNLKRQSLYILV